MPKFPPRLACIDLEALHHNHELLKQLSDPGQVILCIKADAYGHGLKTVVSNLKHADGFAVADIDQALIARSLTDARIILMSSNLDADALTCMAAHRIDWVVFSEQQCRLIEKTRLNQPITVWLKLNTGLNRMGINPKDYDAIRRRLADLAHIENIIQMTHLAHKDHYEKNNAAIALAHKYFIDSYPISIANTSTVLRKPNLHHTFTRPGIGLYGLSPFNHDIASQYQLRAVMSVSASIIAINHCKKGSSIGYDGLYVCHRDSRIGVVAFGYADGYPRQAKSGTPILIRGQLCPLVGRVSMDTLMVDLTDLNDVSIDDRAILWGPDLPLEVLAGHCLEHSGYEILCHLGKRVKRQTIDHVTHPTHLHAHGILENYHV